MTKDTEHQADSHDYGQEHTDDDNLHPFVLDIYLYGDPGMQPAGHRSHHKHQQGADVVYGWFS